MRRRAAAGLLALLPLLSACPNGPGQGYGDECTYTITIADSCTGCEGFERYELTLTDADAATHDIVLQEQEQWVEVLPPGDVTIDGAAILFGNPYGFETVVDTCDYESEFTFGCSGFDFCE